MKILITGGASGLGRSITEKLANVTGNIVYFTYNSSRDGALELEKAFDNTKAIHVDFTSKGSIEAFIILLTELSPAILINNAYADYKQSHFHKINPEVFEQGFYANIYPVLRITQSFIAECRKRKSGKIITILTSAIINRPPAGLSEYVANKAYIYSMAKSWATENSSMGVTSNCISPSFMESNMTSSTDSRIIEQMISDNPNKRLLSMDEVAETVLYLTTASSQINGANIIINAAKDVI